MVPSWTQAEQQLCGIHATLLPRLLISISHQPSSRWAEQAGAHLGHHERLIEVGVALLVGNMGCMKRRMLTGPYVTARSPIKATAVSLTCPQAIKPTCPPTWCSSSHPMAASRLLPPLWYSARVARAAGKPCGASNAR